MEEIWKDIEGYKGKYQVSNFGKVKNTNTNHILSQSKNNCGYYRVGLYFNKVNKRVDVHRLVAEAFINNPEQKKEVNHINGNKKDNSINNLEWVTHKENICHAWKEGLFETVRKASKRYGKNNPSAKKVIQYDLDGNEIRRYDCIAEAVKATNINKTSIGKCCSGRQKTAGNYIWKFDKQ